MKDPCGIGISFLTGVKLQAEFNKVGDRKNPCHCEEVDPYMAQGLQILKNKKSIIGEFCPVGISPEK